MPRQIRKMSYSLLRYNKRLVSLENRWMIVRREKLHETTLNAILHKHTFK